MEWDGLNEAQQASARLIYEKLAPAFEDERKRLATLLASKDDHELFGETEFRVRDAVHQLGAKAIEAALEERQKKGLRGC